LGGRGRSIVGGGARGSAGFVVDRLGRPHPGAVDDGLEVAVGGPDQLSLRALDLVLEVGGAPAEQTRAMVSGAGREVARTIRGGIVEGFFEVGLSGTVIQALVGAGGGED